MDEQKRVLLTVSGVIPDGLEDAVASGLRPRADYTVMAQAFEADLVDVETARRQSGNIGRITERIAGVGGLLAWYCFAKRKRYDVIVTDGEQVGIPLALLGRLLGRGGARHVMICHVLSTPSKRRLLRSARLTGMIDRYVTYSSWQSDFVRTALRVPEQRIFLTPFMVDTDFFSTGDADDTARTSDRPLICSAGLERRDYHTLIDAVAGVPVDVLIAAGSKWSKHRFDSARALPENVVVKRLDELSDLRNVYAQANFVVMPLEDVDFQAGITTILEAMSMELPVICTRTRGQTDTIVDGETGRYVGVGDVAAMRRAIVEFIDNEDETHAMGQRARAWVVEHAAVQVYAEGLAAIVRSEGFKARRRR